MNLDNDYDNEGNNIVPCPICLNVYCPSKQDGKCPEEDEYAASFNTMQETLQDRLQREVREKYSRAIAKNAMGYEELEDIISHTISETIKAGVSVIEGERRTNIQWANTTDEIKNRMLEIFDAHNQALQTAVTKLQELLFTNDRSV